MRISASHVALKKEKGVLHSSERVGIPENSKVNEASRLGFLTSDGFMFPFSESVFFTVPLHDPSASKQ